MIVATYMTRGIETVSPRTALIDAIKIMSHLQIRRLVVKDGARIVGIVCHRDLANAFPDHVNPFSPAALTRTVSSERVSRFMRSPVITIDERSPLEQAAGLMTDHHIGSLPVLAGGKPVGIITESDIFRALTKVLSVPDHFVRITFDLLENENVLPFLAAATVNYELTLASFLSIDDGGRRIAVATVRGKQVHDLIDDLWSSGHRVMDVLRYGDLRIHPVSAV